MMEPGSGAAGFTLHIILDTKKQEHIRERNTISSWDAGKGARTFFMGCAALQQHPRKVGAHHTNVLCVLSVSGEFADASWTSMFGSSRP